MLSILEHQKISEYLETLQKLDTESALWKAVVAFYTSLGAESLAYIHLAPTQAEDDFEQSAKLHGISESWTRYYAENQLQHVDPFLQHVRHSVTPFIFTDNIDVLDLPPAETKFLSDLREKVGIDILGMPVFGPSSRNGSFAIGFEQIPDFSSLDIQMLHWASQAFHNHICARRIKRHGVKVKLTERERIVLGWMSKGQPNEAISQLLGQSSESIRITINGIYKKMHVRDRNSALEFAALSGLLRSNGNQR